MIGVTIGIGRAYREMAELAAESVRKWTGLDVDVITDAAGMRAAEVKLTLLERYSETVFYFDADTRMVNAWPELREYEGRESFIASKHDASEALDRDCEHYKLNPDRFFYAGLWIANRQHAAAFKHAIELCQSDYYRTSFGVDQTALNVAMQRFDVDFQPLPWERHVVCAPENLHKIPADASVLHIAGAHLQGENRKIFEREILRRERCN